jgi:hypothetical protein
MTRKVLKTAVHKVKGGSLILNKKHQNAIKKAITPKAILNVVKRVMKKVK